MITSGILNCERGGGMEVGGGGESRIDVSILKYLPYTKPDKL